MRVLYVLHSLGHYDISTHTRAHTHKTTDRTSDLLISSNVHYVHLGRDNYIKTYVFPALFDSDRVSFGDFRSSSIFNVKRQCVNRDSVVFTSWRHHCRRRFKSCDRFLFTLSPWCMIYSCR